MRRFTQADIHELAPTLVDALLKKVEQGGSAEKIAENDYLMKCSFGSLTPLTASCSRAPRYHARHYYVSLITPAYL